MILICISLMIVMLILFFHLLAIQISSFEKCLFGSFAHFLIRLFGFLLFICLNSLCSLNISTLTDT